MSWAADISCLVAFFDFETLLLHVESTADVILISLLK